MRAKMRVELEGKVGRNQLVHPRRRRHHHGDPVDQLPALLLRPRLDQREEFLDAELAIPFLSRKGVFMSAPVTCSNTGVSVRVPPVGQR